jgi:hypothetical protein
VSELSVDCNLEGLYLSSFDAGRIRINRKVQEFYGLLAEYSERHKGEQPKEGQPTEGTTKTIKLIEPLELKEDAYSEI